MEWLQHLLKDGTRYAPRYLPSMNSDHMPMTLCAISGLGGDYEACVVYRDDYSQILHEIHQVKPARNWRDGIGRRGMYPSLLAFFREQVEHKGIEWTVATYLPEFVVSLAMDAFHPIIRLGYAIDFHSGDETAAALAFLISCHRDVPVSVDVLLEFEQCLQEQAHSGPRSFDTTSFGRSIVELLDAGIYPVGIAADIGECAAVALDIYRSTRNFFALHMVTATQAIRICSSVIDEKLALATLTGGLLAAHQVVGSPSFDRSNPMPVPDQLDREHAYKYAWACLSEYRYNGDERYAEEIRGFREIGLIPSWCAKETVN